MGRFARSWELVKLCWQVLQQDKELIVFAVAVVGIGLGVLIMSAGVVVLGIAVIAVAVIVIMVISLLGATLRGIYAAALYEYAVGGATGAIDQEMLAGAFQPKRSRRVI